MNILCLSALNLSELFLVAIFAIAGIILLFALVVEIIVAIRTYSCRAVNESGLNGEQTAYLLLEKLEIQDIHVRKLNWITRFLGNHYNPQKKTIFLTPREFKKPTINAIGTATRLVALVIHHKEGNKKFKTKAALQPYLKIIPFLFIPIILLGLILDLIFFQSIGLISGILVGGAFLSYILAFIFLFLTFPAEKNANKLALEILEQTNLLNEIDRQKMKKIYDIYTISALAKYLIEAYYIFWILFDILKKIFKRR